MTMILVKVLLLCVICTVLFIDTVGSCNRGKKKGQPTPVKRPNADTKKKPKPGDIIVFGAQKLAAICAIKDQCGDTKMSVFARKALQILRQDYMHIVPGFFRTILDENVLGPLIKLVHIENLQFEFDVSVQSDVNKKVLVWFSFKEFMVRLKEAIMSSACCTYFRGVVGVTKNGLLGTMLQHLNKLEIENRIFIYETLRMLNLALGANRRLGDAFLNSTGFAQQLDPCLCKTRLNTDVDGKFIGNFYALAHLIENFDRTYELKNNEFVLKT